MFKRSLFVAACFVVSFSAMAAANFPINVAGTGTPLAESCHSSQAFGNINDGKFTTQVDFYDWAALVWDTPQTLDRIIVHMLVGYQIKEFEVWVAKPDLGHAPVPGIPTNNDGDWVLLKTVTSANGYAFTPEWNTAGVLVVAKDYGNQGVARINNIWAYQNYDNLALQAAFSAPGWDSGGSSVFRDEMFSQSYNGGFKPFADREIDETGYNAWLAGNPYINFTYAAPVELAGSLVVGGSGVPGEYLIDYNIEYRDLESGEWLVALAVRGNGDKYDWRDFDVIATAKDWRLAVLAVNDATGGARVSEIMLFAASVPEPATMTLLALGGLAMLRRR